MKIAERAPDQTLIVAVFVLLTLIWGTTWAAIRAGLEGLPPLTGVSLRFGIAATLLFLALRLFGVRFTRTRRERVLWCVTAALGYAVPYSVVYWTGQWVPSGLASVLFATFPLFVALFAHQAIPAEQMSLRGAVGVVGGFVGIAVIFSQDFALIGGADVAFAAGVALVAPAVAAIGSVAVKRYGAGIHPLSLTAVPMALTAATVGVLAALLERDRVLVFDATSIGALLYLSVAGTAVTFSLYYWLLARVAASRLALIAYTTPIVAVLVGAAVFREPITTRMVIGGAMVIAGVALAATRGERLHGADPDRRPERNRR